VNLEKIHLEASRDLVEIPDLSKAEKLKRIDLSDCESLRKLHPSISSLPKLAHLELSGCRKIENLNVHSKYLQRLNLEGCSSLKELSVTSHKMVFLDLSYTAICSLPSSIQYNTELARLFLKGCDNLSFVQSPPNIIGHLFSLLLLDLSGTNVESLPASIKNLSMMKLLVLDDCRTLVSLLELPRSLEMLTAYNCTSLETVFTQLLVSEHMLQSCKPYLSKQYYYPKQFEGGCAVFPGDHIMNDFGFHAEDSSITIPYLSLPELCGFICCFVLSEGSIEGHISCSIYQDSEQVGIDEGQLLHTALISDHVVFLFVEICDHFNGIPFKFQFNYYLITMTPFDTKTNELESKSVILQPTFRKKTNNEIVKLQIYLGNEYKGR